MRAFFDELYDHYHQDLFQFIFYMVKDRHLAEDLVQDVYVKVLKSYSAFHGRSSEKTWLFSIARHVTIDYFRRQKRKRDRVAEFFDWSEKGSQLPDHDPLPEEMVIQSEDVKDVYRAMNQCSIDQRTVLILRYIQGLSIKETSEVTGWTESKVKTTQHRALKAVKEVTDSLEGGGGEHEKI
ncbi:RNA polymerase sigma factor SigX [Halobacillus halophilus]|uniref:RNA polymerase sigma factor SigX n=1 Tax=Halobacillus TaxID=45667 RepID=UPI0013682E08|nr:MULTISPECIES: RNA polymerase sigma factor SigX [Halobacillus]MCA1022711.1 RNA polymerase sigma factor SigX [Halobacillus litoralis]MYL28608.1 RNA polymerase sigma factor SigX [Halobacillus halophilus]